MASLCRFDPYKRDTTRITDLCEMLSSATASTIKEGTAMVDDEENLSALDAAHAGSDGDDEGCDETRGKILQRHKREWKSLRSRLNDLKAHKKAMGHGTLAKKDAKKDVAKEIKNMEEVMRSDPASPVPANVCVPNLATSHATSHVCSAALGSHPTQNSLLQCQDST